MRSLSVCTFLLSTFFGAAMFACASHDDEGTAELMAECMQPIDALQLEPSHADLVTVASELQDLGCGELAIDGDPSSLKYRGGCGCDGDYCVCTCGNGGKCEKVGASTWICGCRVQ